MSSPDLGPEPWGQRARGPLWAERAGPCLLTWAESGTPSLGCLAPRARVFSGTSACGETGIAVRSEQRQGRPPSGQGVLGWGVAQGHWPGLPGLGVSGCLAAVT